MLSDACFDFLHSIRAASVELAEDVEHYGSDPFHYGDEIEALRQACQAVEKDEVLREESLVRLVQLAGSVMRCYDSSPFTPEGERRRTHMAQLVRIFRSNLDAVDAAQAEIAAAELGKDDDSVEKPARLINSMVKKLGSSAYEVAIRVISDIASETAKKFFSFS